MISTKGFALAIAFMALNGSIPFAFATNDSQSELMKEATVTEAQAKETALARVTNGVIKSSELEKEHGRLIWSFDISKPSSKNITEVNVDAKTGKIVAVRNETPAKEKREAKAEQAEK